MNSETGNPFLRIWALGYHRLCPIVPPGAPLSERSSLHRRLNAKNPVDERGKAPGVRWPDGSWSGFDFVAHESTERDIERWHGMGAGVGIKTGRGLVLIDADTLDENHARIIRDEIVERFGQLPVRIGNYPKAGYLVRTDEDFTYTRIEFGERDDKGRLRDRVEILSEGRQFVAHGVHPKTGKPYRWPDGLPPYESLPHVDAAALHGLLDALRHKLPSAGEIVIEGAARDVNQDSLRAPIEVVAKAVRATPNTSDNFPTREAWRDFGYAIKGAAGPDHEDEALALFQDWSASWQDGDNDPDYVAAEFGRFKAPFKVGASKLFETAERFAAPGAFTIGERWHEPIDESAPLFGDFSRTVFGDGSAKQPTKLFDLTPFDEAATTALSAAAAPLVKGVLDQGAMTVLYGESNAGKTFVAMDLAYHISKGAEWAGRRTAAFPVLYIAAEGGQGARKRAAALAARHGPSGGFWFLMHPINLLRADADLRPLLATVAATGQRFGLIVVDTLSRAMAGGDENSSTDMGAMVKHLDVLRKGTGAHVLTVHHSGKDRARGARGHSLLRAATDTEIEVADGQIVVTKQRDLDGSFATAFGLDVVTLGVDADGDPVTSCTVRLGVKTEAGKAVPTPTEDSLLQAFEALQATSSAPEKGISIGEIVAYFALRSDTMSDKNARFYVSGMLERQFVERVGRGRYKLSARSDDRALPEPMIENMFD